MPRRVAMFRTFSKKTDQGCVVVEALAWQPGNDHIGRRTEALFDKTWAGSLIQISSVSGSSRKAGSGPRPATLSSIDSATARDSSARQE